MILPGNHIFVLPDGRQLAYCIFGPSGGEPVFYFHGTPSSRLEPLIQNVYHTNLDGILARNNVCLVSVDRPGMGSSTFDKHTSFSSFAADIFQLATGLGIKKCKVLAWSGGGPYSLALANKYPSFVQSVHIITGFTVSFSEPGILKGMSGNKYYFGAAKYIPWLMRLIMNYAGKQTPRKPLSQLITRLPDVDHQLMTDPAKYMLFNKLTLNEACKNGSKGLVFEAGLYFNDFGFSLSNIGQPVYYWWGTSDNVVKKVHPYAAESMIPDCRMHYRQNEGHLSIYINCFSEVIQAIAGG